MVLEEFIQRLESLRDNINVILKGALEVGVNSIMSVIISDIQLNDRFKLDYSEAYKKTRQKKGRQTEFVDLTFTGDMFRGLQIVEIEEEESRVTIHLGFVRQRDFDVFQKNIERYGQILDPNSEEQEQFREDVRDMVISSIQDYLK